MSQRAFALTEASELRVAINTDKGVRMIFGTLDGESEVRTLDIGVTNVSHLVALPNDRVALLSDDSKITVLDAAGGVLWQHDYTSAGARSQGAVAGMIFNLARQELVVAGQTADGGSWMTAVDLDGQSTWQLQRQPQPIDEQEDRFRLVRGHGPSLVDVAAGPDGSLVAPGSSNQGLVYFMVGAGSCKP